MILILVGLFSLIFVGGFFLVLLITYRDSSTSSF